MASLRLSWFLIACTAVAHFASSGCSVDAKRNRGRRCDGTCECYKGFCLEAVGNAQDGGDADGASAKDGGSMDAGDAPRPCDEEGAVELCYDGDPRTVGKGLCTAGTRTCTQGRWSTCEGQHLPTEEICNNEDDDCDAVIDEDVPTEDCVANQKLGACAEGIGICRAGEVKCVSIVEPEPEMCGSMYESQDLDCDGVEGAQDPDLAVPCYESDDKGCEPDGAGGFTCRGECRAGIKRCDGACEGAVYARDEEETPEPADGGLPEIRDEDCDGKFDEGFECAPGEYACYTGPASTRGEGACMSGTRSCGDAGLGPCEGEVTPTAETCANEDSDDDCNGFKDDIPHRNEPCFLGSATPCHVKATLKCDPNSSSEELVCTPAPGEPEACDGVDNDCDTRTDEGSLCGSNQRACCNGTCVDTQYNDQHCGGCGNVCGPGLSCCLGQCVNLQSNNKHCGRCNAACKLLGLVQTACRSGKCSL